MSNIITGLGFSLGGNILMKYLGEKTERQKNFHFATSVCSGYDVPECNEFFKQWTNLRRFYNYGLTRNVLKIVKVCLFIFHFLSWNDPSPL